jgi:Flp pilus assembly CpaE family ATPase
VERPLDPLELVMSLREDTAELLATVTHLSSDMVEVKQDPRRLDDRLFQLMLLQLGTLATALASLVAVLAS